MIFETYAHRKRLETQGELDVYRYDVAPEQLRHQLCMTFREGIGYYFQSGAYDFNEPHNANDLWREVDKVCRKELLSYLEHTRERNLSTRFCNFVMHAQDIDDFLSAVEIGCVALSVVKDDYGSMEHRGAEQRGDEAIKEVNYRFEQHAIGFQFENRHIIRVDSTIVHAEVIKPALMILTAPLFAKANEDFMTSHTHYRNGAYKDCVTAANRAFESTLKAICDAELWAYDKGDRASELVTKVTTNGLFTHDFDKGFMSYVAMLKTGLPAVRNDAGGHGEGLSSAAVTPQIARFALNLTATNILFLGELYKALKGQ